MPDHGGGLIDERDTRRSDALLVSLSLLTSTAAGGLASILLGVIIGAGRETDAVIAAYSLFFVIALIAATARTAVVPMLSPVEPEAAFRARIVDVGGRISLLGLAGAMGLVLVTPLLGLIYESKVGSDAAWIAAEAVLILAPAAWLQVHTAAASAALTAAGRVRDSAAVYLAYAVALLVLIVPCLLVIGGLGMPVAILIASAILAAGHQRALRGFSLRLDAGPRRLVERAQRQTAAAVLLAAILPLTFQVQFVVALAAVGGEPGDVTAYAYGYYLLIAAVTATGSALSLGTLASLVGAIAADGRRAVGDYAAGTVPVALAVLVPFVAVTVAFGEPLIEVVLGDAFDPEGYEDIVEVIAALAPFAFANAAVVLIWPAALALGQQRFVAWVGLGQILAMVALAVALRGSIVGVAASQSAVAIAVLAVIWVRVCGRDAGRAAVRLARALAPVALAALGIAAVRLVAGDGVGLAEALLLVPLSLAAYLAIGTAVAPGLFAGLPVVGLPARRRLARAGGE